MPKRFGIPQPSKYTLLSQMISDPSRDLAFANGGNIVSGITSALKAGLGTYGGLQDRRTQEEYQQSQADLQQQQTEQEKELKEKEANLGYYKLGIDCKLYILCLRRWFCEVVTTTTTIPQVTAGTIILVMPIAIMVFEPL